MTTMNSYKYILLILVLHIFVSALGQAPRNTYTLESDNHLHIDCALKTEDRNCQPVALRLDVTYSQHTGEISVAVYNKYEKPHKRKLQYTHLWCPMSFGNDYIKLLGMDEYFARNFKCKTQMSKPFTSQMANFGTGYSAIEQAFSCINGQILNKWKNDEILSLSDDALLTITIKVENVEKPVELKFNNIIPVTAKYDIPHSRNKVVLNYIFDNLTFVFKIPKNDCADMNDLIQSVKRQNDNLRKDYKDVYNYSKMQGCDNDCIAMKMIMLKKYETAYHSIQATKCSELANIYATFKQTYEKVSIDIITPDSLKKLQNKLDTLANNIFFAKNTNNNKEFKHLKDVFEQYDRIRLPDTALFKEMPDLYIMVKNFESTKNTIEKLIKEEGGGRPCIFDEKRINDVSKRIESCLNCKKLSQKERETFKQCRKCENIDKEIRQTDEYIKDLNSKCKQKHTKCINQYNTCKNQYNDAQK